MNHGSIESRSSATSAVDLLGVRAPASDFSSRSQSAGDRFDSIFDNLNQNQKSWGESNWGSSLQSGSSVETPSSSGLYDECRNESLADVELDEASDGSLDNIGDEVIASESETAEVDSSEVDSSEVDSSGVDDVDSTDGELKQTNNTGETAEVSAEAETEPSTGTESVAANTTEKKVSVAQGPASEGANKRAVKVTEAGKVSSSKSFQLQTQKVTVAKDGEAEKSAKTTVVRNEATKVAAETATVQPSSEKTVAKGILVKTDESKTVSEPAGKDVSAEVSKLKAALKASAKSDAAKIGEVKTESNEGTSVKKSTDRPAKTSTTVQATTQADESNLLKNTLKTVGTQAENRLAQVDQEIGIKTAEQALTKQNKMVAEVKQSDTTTSEKGFLKEGNNSGALNRAQAVTSRSEMGGFFSQSQNSDSSRGDSQQNSRRGEQFRQWIEGSSDVRGVSQAAQQGELVDRAVGSLLSGRVLNQIVNHIEKLRESEKNRVKVSLGSEANGVTVDIRIEGDAIYTTFEGDPQILNQLKDEWDDIKDRASQKGVALSDPEFIEISYSSSSEGESLLPDDGIAKEEKSQSVIQHKNNQPVRPGEMTAAAGSSGPVHSFYA